MFGGSKRNDNTYHTVFHYPRIFFSPLITMVLPRVSRRCEHFLLYYRRQISPSHELTFYSKHLQQQFSKLRIILSLKEFVTSAIKKTCLLYNIYYSSMIPTHTYTYPRYTQTYTYTICKYVVGVYAYTYNM